MRNDNVKTDMLEHSQAKVALYQAYLSTWLNIMLHSSSVSTVFIFDLFAGEGLYESDRKGSAIVACDAARNHYYSANESDLDIHLWFNDNGMSRFEAGVRKIDRIKKIVDNLHLPPNTDVRYFCKDYDDMLPITLVEVQATESAKGLFFLDPYGYKDIDPDDICEIIMAGDTEVILFVPISHMYRFACASLEDDFPGSSHLRTILKKLFNDGLPKFSSVRDFIQQLKERFRIYIDQESVFVDTFTLQRDPSNVYALFFFTSHIKGFEKMLETKWRMDKQSGEGYRKERSMRMFSEVELRSYAMKIINYISKSDHRTNHELYRYGLENGFLPKHTGNVLRDFMKDHKLERFSIDGKQNRGNYLQYRSTRTVGFRLKQDDTQDH